MIQKNLPTGVTNIRLNNIVGGNTPSYLFAGIIESSAIMGDTKLSSTCFKQHSVQEFDVLIDGQSEIGFPIRIEEESPVRVFNQYLNVTNRKFNNLVSETIPIRDFASFHYLYAHKFTVGQTDTGWLSINLKLAQEYTQNYTLGEFFIIIFVLK